MHDGPLKLQDPDFWGDYRKTEAEVREWMDGQGFHGLLLDLPDTVAIGVRSTIPVVGWFVRTLREDILTDPVRQTLAVAINLDTNRVLTGLALDSGKTPAPSRPPAGFDPGAGITLSMFDFDLRRALDIPWRGSRYGVVVLLADNLSNRGTVAVVDQKYEDPAVAEFLRQWRHDHPGPPPVVWPPVTTARYPSYVSEDGSPPLPETAGIAVSSGLDRGDRRGASTLLCGSFRLPCLPAELVRRGGRTDVGHADATAVLGVTLVMTGALIAGPWVLPLHVPVFDAIDPAAPTALVAGHFNIDLASLPQMPDRPGTYYLYAFAGARTAGPIPLTL